MGALCRRVLPPALVLLGVTTVVLSPPAHADASIEAEVFNMIRSTRYIVPHSGLLSVARDHSMGMSRRGGLDHNDADARIRNAPPDPYEINGAPDDGSPPASWCENVTYVMAAPQSEVAGRIYAAWERSGAHDRCMKDAKRNVGAVGVYYDGQTWWATFIAMIDTTPPGGAAPRATNEPTAADEPKPTATSAASVHEPVTSTAEGEGPAGLLTDLGARPTTAPAVTVQTTPQASVAPIASTQPFSVEEPSAMKQAERRPAAQDISIAYGWQEVLAVALLLSLATYLLSRSMQRAPEVERRDRVAFPEVELVGAAAVGV